jgi:hypothetical protein
MPRESAESKAAKIWRAGTKLPSPPADLSPSAKKHWRTLVKQREAWFWTPSARISLQRLCATLASVEVTQKAYDADPTSKSAPGLCRQLTGLNSSVVSLMRQLRLNPVQEHKSDATDKRADRPPLHDDRLIGGRAVRDFQR